jgi:hypothetical protein
MEDIIKLWKEHNITQGEFNFNCGGDSMGDTDLVFHSSNEKGIPTKVISELEGYFEDEVYNNINFYECSDGHYIGEAGVVYIELDEEGNVFSYCKSAQAEWSECLSSEVRIPLTDEEVKFVKNYVANINGGEGDFTNVNYSKDFIMTDKEEEIQKVLMEKVDEYVNDFEPNWNGEPQDWFGFNNADDIIEGNELVINLDNYEYIYTDSEN